MRTARVRRSPLRLIPPAMKRGGTCIEGSGGAVTGRLVVGTADRGPDRLEWTVVRHHRGHQPGCAALSTGSLAADPRPDGLMQQCRLKSCAPGRNEFVAALRHAERRYLWKKLKKASEERRGPRLRHCTTGRSPSHPVKLGG